MECKECRQTASSQVAYWGGERGELSGTGFFGWGGLRKSGFLIAEIEAESSL